MKRIVAAACVTLMMAGTAACGSSAHSTTKKATTTPPPPEPQVGACYAKGVADQDDIAPDLTSKVPCTKPHTWEIVGVHDIDQKFLTGKTEKQKLENRTKLAAVNSTDKAAKKLHEEYTESAGEDCLSDWAQAAGMADMKIDGKPVAAQLNIPGANEWLNVSSPALWKAGSYETICSFSYYDIPEDHKNEDGNANLTPAPVTSPDTKPLISHYVDGQFPTDARSCRNWTRTSSTAVACSKPHSAEFLFYFDDKPFLSKSDIDTARKNQRWSESAIDKVNQQCRQALKPFTKSLKGSFVIELSANPPDKDASQPVWVYCVAAAKTGGGKLPGGSIFDSAPTT